MKSIRSVITGYGSYLPEKVLTNDDLSKMVDTSDEWITERTGMKKRHIAAEGEYTSDLAINAAKIALKKAGLKGNDIDLIVVATATPDMTFPSTATRVQAALGGVGCPALDIHAVCAGFVYAMNHADNAIRLGQAKNALVIGAETLSRIVDWTDRNTCVLFGDGAGAFVLSAQEGKGDATDRGVLYTRVYADGRQVEHLRTDGGVSSTKTAGFINMNGREVFRHAVKNMHSASMEALKANGLSADDVDWIIPHQANNRIIESMTKKFGGDNKKVISTVHLHANTSAASIPLALCEAVDDGRIKQGDLIVSAALGAGFAWGASLFRL
ncbi:MAG: ketoacyl-ACP synthase III [Alphaproteobacteria bacterium]|nr:ketoacyl-ACP synthase III [Alphaproteobacteria bacterium]